jgi:CelD/BcsL family acetyltransferase involved in cellulose biosynthesis
MKIDLTADLIEEEDAIAALAPEWWDLWRRTLAATPFQSPAWSLPWWDHFHPGALFVVAVRHQDWLVALAPFYIENGSLGRRILPIGISISDYLDVLIDPAFADAAGRVLVEYIASRSARWDAWNLEELAPDAAALALPTPECCEEQVVRQSACPVLVFPEGAKELTAAVPQRKQRNLKLARNRAVRRSFAVEQADVATAPRLLDVLVRLHGARWESRSQAGVLADETVGNFHSVAMPGLMQAGLVRLYVLRIGGEPAAAYYGFMHGARAYVYLTGFDPRFTFESPGVILLAHAVEQALAEGAHEFHFLRGREAYKYEWGAEDRWNMRRSFQRKAGHAAHA